MIDFFKNVLYGRIELCFSIIIKLCINLISLKGENIFVSSLHF